MTGAKNIEKKIRVIVYIDGFNLYFGIKEAGYKQCKWLDLHMLASSLLQSNQELIEVKYLMYDNALASVTSEEIMRIR